MDFLILFTYIFSINHFLCSTVENKLYLIDSLYNDKVYEQAFLEARKLYNENSQNVDVICRIAGTSFIKAHNEKDSKKQIKYFYHGFEYAKEGLKLDSLHGYANFWYAAYIGRIGEIEGIKQGILNSYEVQKYGERALKFNPNYEHSHHLMARWNYELADLSQFERMIASIVYAKPPYGSYKDAAQLFQNAININPDEIRHHFWLAKTYYAMKDYSLSKKEFQITISLTPKDEEDRQMQSKSKKYF